MYDENSQLPEGMDKNIESEDAQKAEWLKRREFSKGCLSAFIVTSIVAFIAIIYVSSYYNSQIEKVIEMYKPNVSDGSEKNLSEINEKMQLLQSYIDNYFLFEEKYPEVAESVYKAMLEALDDPYSCYYTAEEYKSIMESSSGKYVGIGAVVQKDEETGYIKVVSLFEESGAKESGVKADDLIMEIKGESTEKLELSTAASLMKGEEGTTVDIKVLRPSTKEELSFTITRKQIETVTVSSQMLDNNIGYIYVTEFDDVTVKQFKDELDKLTEQGMKGLIVDLRNNPGGLLNAVNSMLDELLPKGLIVYTEDKYGNKKEYNSDEKYNDVPMAVLVNGNSASASEIFAGAMKDHKRATLVGTKTFGKGIVQTIRQLQDGSAIKLTISRYFTPNGICIHGEGITPDIVVELDEVDDPDKEITWRDDTQIMAAFEALNK